MQLVQLMEMSIFVEFLDRMSQDAFDPRSFFVVRMLVVKMEQFVVAVYGLLVFMLFEKEICFLEKNIEFFAVAQVLGLFLVAGGGCFQSR